MLLFYQCKAVLIVKTVKTVLNIATSISDGIFDEERVAVW